MDKTITTEDIQTTTNIPKWPLSRNGLFIFSTNTNQQDGKAKTVVWQNRREIKKRRENRREF
jgi:hypothetical protein